MYNAVLNANGNGICSNHQFKKKKINPKNRQTEIFAQVIFSSFTPLVPKQDKARKTNANILVQTIDENNPVVR
jgi:hypothetical protein